MWKDDIMMKSELFPPGSEEQTPLQHPGVGLHKETWYMYDLKTPESPPALLKKPQQKISIENVHNSELQEISLSGLYHSAW